MGSVPVFAVLFFAYQFLTFCCSSAKTHSAHHPLMQAHIYFLVRSNMEDESLALLIDKMRTLAEKPAKRNIGECAI